MLHDFLTRLADLVDTVVAPQTSPLSNLDRSIKAASAAHLAARRALAVAIAEEERESKRRTVLADKLNDLEQRAIEALRGGRDDLATNAAELIAAVESEVQASTQASVRFAAEVALARREVDAQRRRLADLDRGRRLARVGAALNGAPRGRQSRRPRDPRGAGAAGRSVDRTNVRSRLWRAGPRPRERRHGAAEGQGDRVDDADHRNIVILKASGTETCP
jgi:hypothetical protein